MFSVGGGKVELWDLTTGDNVHSVRAHEEAITDLQVNLLNQFVS